METGEGDADHVRRVLDAMTTQLLSENMEGTEPRDGEHSLIQKVKHLIFVMKGGCAHHPWEKKEMSQNG